MGPLLIDSNPYLRTAAERERQIFQTVATSSAIEGVRVGARKARKASQKPGAVSPERPAAGASASARSPRRRAR